MRQVTHAASVSLETRAGRLLVSLSPRSSQAADPLRTRCPGPELGQHAFTRASLPRTALRHRVLTVAPDGNAFGDGPYGYGPARRWCSHCAGCR